MTTYIRRRNRRRTHRRPVLFETSGLWHPCTEKAELMDGAPVELGVVRGLLHRSPFGTAERDMMHVAEGDYEGWWLPV